MSAGLLAVRLLLAAVFAVAGAAKLADRDGFHLSLTELGVPRPLVPAVAWLVPLVELAVAAALVPTSSARAAAGATVVLLVVFSLAMTRVLVRGERPDCGCFGRALSSRLGPGTLARNAVLATFAVAVALAGPGKNLGGTVTDLDLPVAVLAVAALAQALVAWQLFRQNGRLLERVRALEAEGEAA